MNNVKQLLEEGYEFNASKYVKDGWKLFSNHAGPFIGMTLFFLIILFVLSVVPVISNFSNLISSCLFAGMYVFAGNTIKGTNSAKDFFGGFPFIGQILAHNITLFVFLIPGILLIVLAGFPIMDFFSFLTGGLDPNEFGELVAIKLAGASGFLLLAALVTVLLSIYLSTSYLFVIPLITLEGLGFWVAMETSRKVVGKNFFGIFGWSIVLGIAAGIATVITCGIGLLLIVPFVQMIVFSAYVSIFKPFDADNNQIDEFGSGSADTNTEAEEQV